MDKWIEIDISAIEQNLREVQSRLKMGTRLIAVIKANAYGQGAIETARILSRQGVDFFAVSFLEEALQLRQAGIQAPLLVFSPVISPDGIRDAMKNRIGLTVASTNDLELIEEVCSDAVDDLTVHIKIDTGLGRFGLNQEQALLVWGRLANISNVELEGIYTHTADPSSPASAEKQFQQFMQIADRLEQSGATVPLRHIANSTVFLRSPHMHLDGVRIGTLLTGQHPVGDFTQRLQLQEPFAFKTRIVSLRNLPQGSRLGYFGTYLMRTPAQVAVIPVGFHDGLALEVANKPINLWDLLKKLAKIILGYFDWPGQDIRVTIGDQSFPVRGKVFMQMALLVIPLGIEIKVGDVVTVPIRKTLAAHDIPRIYLDKGTYSDQGNRAADG